MSEFQAIVSNLDLLEVVEEALYHLESVFEEEGLTHVLDPDKCLSVLRGLSKGEVIHTLGNLLSDTELLEDTILKIHYIYALTKAVHDRKINLTTLVIALKDVTTQSIKFLTPQDISFLYSTLPPSKIASGAQSAAKQIDHIKMLKEELFAKTSELVDHDADVRAQLDQCCVRRDQYMTYISDSIKGRFLSSEYSAASSNNNNSNSSTTDIATNTTAAPTPTLTRNSSGSSDRDGSSNMSKSTSARLDSQLNKKNKKHAEQGKGQEEMGKGKGQGQGKKLEVPGTGTGTGVEKKILHALLNKTAEEHVSRLEYDEAYDSLLAEVNKLEKKFVAQKTNKGEVSLRKRMNELLLRQIELAEEKRALCEEGLQGVMAHSREVQEQVTGQRLQRAVEAAGAAELQTNEDLKSCQEQFDRNLIEAEEYFNNLLLDINAKRILEMKKTNSVNAKKLENETRLLVSDKTQFEGQQKMYEEVSDELFNKLKQESKEMMHKFEKVYKATEEIIEENRNIDPNDKKKMRNRKIPLQTELTELYTDIHSLQHNFAENPILDFEIELSNVCDDHEANAVNFLTKSDRMYKECQDTYMDMVLNSYNTSK